MSRPLPISSSSARPNYDFPPASSTLSTSSTPIPNFTPNPRLPGIARRFLDQINDEQTTTSPSDSIPIYAQPHASEMSASETRRRMRSVLRRLRDNDAAWHTTTPPSPLVSIPHTSPRPTATPGLLFRRLRQERSERVSRLRWDARDASESLTDLQEAGERLAQVNQDLRNLLDRPINHSQTSEVNARRAREGSQEDANMQRRHKRRRVDNDLDEKEYPSINYGHYGQVVPGRLKLQLVSSDGGILESPVAYIDRMGSYAAENVLRNDHSVYCTKSARCNMILRHHGGTMFSLSKLVIKAPKPGFTDLVQEGLVFVSMRKDEKFDRTSRYQVLHFPSSRLAPRREMHQHSSLPALRPQRAVTERTRDDIELPDCLWERTDVPSSSDSEPEVANGSIQYARTAWRRDSSSSGSNEDQAGEDGGGVDEPNEGTQAELNARRHVRALFRANHAILDSVQDTLHEQGATHDPNTNDPEDMLAQYDFDEVLRRGEAAAEDRRARRAALHSRAATPLPQTQPLYSTSALVIAPATAPFQATSPIPSTPPIGPSNDLLTPAAHFSMHMHSQQPSNTSDSTDEEDEGNDFQAHRPQNAGIRRTSSSSKITITFDPPISGKYILVKMWSPNQGGNIDVQSISAYGFAGPRFFSTLELK